MSATNVIKGVVDSTRTKTVNTRFGDKAVYMATVDGVEFSTGFKKHFSENEMVSVGVAWKYGEWQYQDGTTGAGMPPATVGATTSAASIAPARGGAARGSGAFPVDPKSGQISIIRQNSMNRAVEILDTWITHNIITISSEEQYLKKLIEIALTVTDFNSGQDIMQLQAAQAANAVAVNG